MMKEVRIERIIDMFDDRLLNFRRKVCQENGADANFFDLNEDFPVVCEKYPHLSESNLQEIWKFGPRKWRKTEFDNLECLLANDEIVGVSGCRRYEDGLLRACMHLYTLKPFRALCAGMQFAPEGVFSRHLEYARQLPGVRSVFMTIFPHNSKLQAHAKNLGGRRLSGSDRPMKFVDRLEPWPEVLTFHGVPQHFFFFPLEADFRFSGRVPLPLLSLGD